MGWGSHFIEAISSTPRTPVWALESIRLLSGGVGGDRDYASHAIGATYSPAIKIGAVRTGGSRLTPLSWTATQGAFSVELFGDASDVLTYYSRGTVVRLMLGFEGWDASEFAPVALGMVKNLRGSTPRWSLECWDLVQAMQTRITSNTAQLELFYGLGAQTRVSTSPPYTTSDNTLTVTSTSGFQSETGGTGAVFVSPDSIGGDGFYLTYTGTSATQFTGVNTSDILGTTRLGLAAPTTEDLVDEVAYINGHPMDLVAKILTSTGAGTNGASDTLPTSWGYGLAEDLVDLFDLSTWKAALVASSGDYEYALIAHEPQSNGLGWLQSQLSGAGIVLVQRQGRLTCRPIQDPNGTDAEPFAPELSLGFGPSHMEITDNEIMGVAYEAWDGQQAAEYANWKLSIVGSSSTYAAPADETVQTLPVADEYESFAPVDADGNAANISLEISNRLKYWYYRIAERLTLTCAGLRLAQLCPGDIVEVTSSVLYGRSEARSTGGTGGAFAARRAMVYGIDPDWVAGRVVVTLAVLPDFGD